MKNTISIITFIVIGLLFPIIGWLSLIYIFRGIELAIGYKAPLVSDPGSIDLGAILTVLIYLLISAFIVRKCISLNNIFLAKVIGILAILFVIYELSMVSSIIWF